jgi:exopolysaccharide biosynthesis protein
MHLVKVMQKMGMKGVKIGNKWYFSDRQIERFFDEKEEDMIDLLRNIDVE